MMGLPGVAGVSSKLDASTVHFVLVRSGRGLVDLVDLVVVRVLCACR